jgi:hypothetical protein
MHDVDLYLMLTLGLVSSLHCATMCGPLIAVATAPLAERRTGAAWLAEAGLWQLAYHLGRGLGYAVAGAALAAAGTSLERLAPARPVGGVLQLAVGALLIGFAVVAMARGKALNAPQGAGLLVRWLRALVTSGRASGLFGLGLLSAALPCGVLYAAYGRAIAAPSIGHGAAFMALFWLGTVPLLFGLGLASSASLRWLGRHARLLVLLAVVSTGGWLAWKGVHNLTWHAASPACPHHHARLAPADPPLRLYS